MLSSALIVIAGAAAAVAQGLRITDSDVPIFASPSLSYDKTTNAFQRRQATRDQIVRRSAATYERRAPAAPMASSIMPATCGGKPFHLRVIGEHTQLNGQYAKTVEWNQHGDRTNSLLGGTRTLARATEYRLTGRCALADNESNEIANIDSGSKLFLVYLSSAGEVLSDQHAPLRCRSMAGNLVCTAGKADTFQVCDNNPAYVAIGDRLFKGCRKVALKVVS